MEAESKKAWVPYALVLPAFLVIALFVIYPMTSAIRLSFVHPETNHFTFENYTYFFQDEIMRGNIYYTLEIVLWTVLVTFVFSYILAAYLRFSTSKMSRLIGNLTLLPRFIPGLVAVYAVILMIKDAGVLSRIANWFGISLSLGWMYNIEGIILMNLWFNIPFSTLILLSGLSNVKDSYVESLKDVGGSNWHILTKLMLPMTYKDIFVSMTFVFMGNIGSFTTPFLMGTTNPKMLGVVLYDQFNSYMAYERAAALSVIMFLICSIAAGAYIWSNMKESVWEKS